MRRLDVACDIGGGFVDLFATGGATPIMAKLPRRDGTLAAMLHAALDAAGIALAEVARLRLSTTLAANALLAGQGAPVALVATAGFTDTPDLGRQSRRDPDRWPPPPPTPPWMAPEHWRIPLRGRIAADGEEAEPLQPGDLNAVCGLPHGTPLAICLLFAHRNPAHELAAAARIAALRPDLPLSLSHRVDPQPREFERMLATLTDASLKPLAARLLAVEGLPQPWVMQAEGGLAPLAEAMQRPLALLGSGPAAGALAAAQAAGEGDAIGLDIGSTTAEVSLHRGGIPLTARGTWLDDMWLRGPALAVESLPLGGATRLHRQDGRIRLGPDIVLDGTAPTLTDAGVLAGLVAQPTPAQREAASRLLAETEAEAALRLAVTWLGERVRRIAFRSNLDPAQATLVVGGGAGLWLAQRLAVELGAARLLVPPHAAVLAATGLARAPAMARSEAACDLPLDALPSCAGTAARQARDLLDRMRDWGPATPAIHHELDLAPGPRAEPIALRWDPAEPADALAHRFVAAARAQRGQAPPAAPRILAIRSIATAALPPP